MSEDEKIECRLCGVRTHVMQAHLKEVHPELTVDEYEGRFPGAPILSPFALRRIEERRQKLTATAVAAPVAGVAGAPATELTTEVGQFHEIFRLGTVKAAMNGRTGAPIPATKFIAPEALKAFVPEIDPGYVFPIDLLKTGVMALEVNTPALFWGHAGTGKSTIWEQICAHTGRPMIRVQHTRNTEEAHVVGQWTARDGSTFFELGPLAFAMKFGLAYLADEYDFGMPAVMSLYQPVLEGKPLVIKEADEANRIIRPHPHFRFIATGNTNGTGDETGLYQGTLLQNAANYERFGIVEQVEYMAKSIEIQVVVAQSGVTKEIAEKLVGFATQVREAFKSGKISLPPSPRAMINAARVGMRRGDFTAGLKLAYVNRLSSIDREAVLETLKRTSF